MTQIASLESPKSVLKSGNTSCRLIRCQEYKGALYPNSGCLNHQPNPPSITKKRYSAITGPYIFKPMITQAGFFIHNEEAFERSYCEISRGVLKNR